MKQRLLDKIDSANKIIAVVGLSKNAGKTTFLNWLVANFPNRIIGIITTGRDGENIDLVSGHLKPKVKVPTDSFFSTFENVIIENSTRLEVIAKLPYFAGGKRLWLVKALEDIKTEIVGPATVKEQIELAEFILSFGVEHVFIDGSLDRKSVALSPKIDSLIIVASSTFGKLEDLRKELAKLVLLSKIKKNIYEIEDRTKICYSLNNKTIISDFSSILNNEKEFLQLPKISEASWIYFPKAFTNRSFLALKKIFQKCDIVFKHPLHIQINFSQLESIFSNILVLEEIKIDAIALNSYSVSGDHLDSELFRAEIRKDFQDIIVIDVSEI